MQVYLPMGYPLQTGQQFDNVIYQGNVVRLYQIPNDPRTESQVFQRKMLADVTHVRGTLCVWSKALCRKAMGSKWSSVLFSAIKADMGGMWTAAQAEWDNLSEVDRQPWRNYAPYQACYNDVGKMFFLLVRAVYWAVCNWGVLDWLVAPLAEDDAERARAWWDGTYGGQWLKGVNDNVGIFLDPAFSQGTLIHYNPPFSETCLSFTQPIQFAYFGKKIRWEYWTGGIGGQPELYIDGVHYYFSNNDGYGCLFTPAAKDMHLVRCEVTGGAFNLNALKVF